MARRTIDPEQLATAERVLNAGGSQRQAAKESGLSPDTIKRRFGGARRRDPHPGATTRAAKAGGRPRGADPPPRSGSGGHRPAAGAPTNEQLESMVRKAAKAPAIPMRLFFHCDYCYNHFLSTAPMIARELVAQSEEDADLREMLVWAHNNWRKYAWAGALTVWAGVPVVHHLAPDFMYRTIAPLAGMPPRSSTPDHSRHEHATASGAPPHATNGATPPPADPLAAAAMAAAGGMNPADILASMPADQLATMAASLGIELDPDELANFMAAPPGVEPEPGEPAPETLDDDFIEPEPADLAVDMIEPDDTTTVEEPDGTAGAGEPAASAETSPPADTGLPDTLL